MQRSARDAAPRLAALARWVWLVSDAAGGVEPRFLPYLATRFAAKEAFSKAIGMGMRMPMTWRAMEVVKARSGKPEVALHGELAAWFAAQGLSAHVTVSDEQDYAVAFVVVERA